MERKEAVAPLAAAYSLGLTDQFLLFGDSITQQAWNQNGSFSFAGALADVYQRKLDIVSRGLSGYNTTQAIRALPLCVPEPENARVQFMTIFFGANDARLRGSPGGPDQYVHVDEFKRNIMLMVRSEAVKAHKDVRVILITTPPIDERKVLKSDQEKFPNLGRTLRRTAQNSAIYAQAVCDLGRELNLPVLDIHTAMLSRAGYSRQPTPSAVTSPTSSPPLPGSMDAPSNATLQSFLEDGLHFSGEGYRVLYGELMALIERTWPDQMPARLPMRLPAWDYEPAWKLDGEGKPPPWEDVDGMVVTGRFEALLSDVQRVS